MNKRILSICLALALCLSLIPAVAFAAEPLYTYTEVKTGVKATNVSMMGNGYGSYRIENEDEGITTAKGVITPAGKVILTRTTETGGISENINYLGTGSAIVDPERVGRFGNYGAAYLSDVYEEGMERYFDIAIYDTNGKLKGYVSEIIADYSEELPTAFRISSTIYYGTDGYVTVYAYVDDAEAYAYIIDPQTMQVIFKKMVDDGSPLATGENWNVTSVNEGLIAYNHGERTLTEDGYSGYEYITAGWMDINGSHKISIDTDKYDNWWNFSSDRAMVSNVTGLWYGYVDKTGNLVIPCEFMSGSMFKDGYAYVQDQDGRYGYINTSGDTVIPFQYEYAFGYGEGLFTVGHAGQYDEYHGMVDKNNTEIVPIQYTDISIAKNGIAYAIKDGEIVILKFAEAEPADPNAVSTIFKDVPKGAWYEKFLQKAYDNNIIGGKKDKAGDLIYDPNGKLTNAEIMVMVANLHAKMKNEAVPMIQGDHWAASFRDYCKSEGVIDARFDEALGVNVVRAEMAYYFARALDIDYYTNKKSISFSDMPENGYDEYIMRLAKANIVGGYDDGTFRPGKDVTRAEAAVFISNILDAMMPAEADSRM